VYGQPLLDLPRDTPEALCVFLEAFEGPLICCST
jgi:hypothetical protein